MLKDAKFSECGNYRYYLSRFWDQSKPSVMCIGLNPSTANCEKDDPTIRQLISRLTYLGYGGFFMCNLFSLVSSKPEKLFQVADNQNGNLDWVREITQQVDTVIFCWGSFKNISHHANKMIEMFPSGKCFGKSKDGKPLHPMALMYGGVKIEDTKLKLWT